MPSASLLRIGAFMLFPARREQKIARFQAGDFPYAAWICA
jgi:hypothetical protein